MGIKSIHLLLILLSIALSGFFGFWCTQQQQTMLATIAYTITASVIVYAVYFLKKARTV